MRYFHFILFVLAVSQFGCSDNQPVIEHGNLIVHISPEMHCLISSQSPTAKPLMRKAMASEYLVTKDFTAKDFSIAKSSVQPIHDAAGSGKEWIIQGLYTGDKSIVKVVRIRLYDSISDMVVMQTIYINNSSRNIEVNKWVNNQYSIVSQDDTPMFWSFQGESTSERKDWVQPIGKDFSQENFMGLSSTDYGGGIPVTDVWRTDQGIAIGHVESHPKFVSLPVAYNQSDTSVNISIQYEYPAPMQLLPGDTLRTAETFVMVHDGDYFKTLRAYSGLLKRRGLKFDNPQESSYESSWCAWGYGRDFTLDEIVGTLPKVKELGIKWVTIDDGFQQALGDWDVNQSKFPKGNDQMKELVAKIHSQGLKAMIWWAPLAVHPTSKLLKDNPDMKLLNSDSTPRDITWWDAYYMSPSYSKTITHTKDVLDLFINEWKFDGIKMDGQHLNAVPSDYNTAHHLEYPEKSFEELPDFFKMIYSTATHYNKEVVLQLCPCGTCMSVYNMPYMNQAVASDPLSSWQIRHKGKTYKALIGKTAYFGDHVELSDGRADFASSFGVGAVLGTKFAWPRENPTVEEANLLTKEHEGIWKKWFAMYDRKMLSKQKYLGELYDIGYDIPETHVIQKDDTLHYSFYNKNWNGPIEFRGLLKKKYQVRDYVHNLDLGVIEGPEAKLKVTFVNSLLLEVFPIAE